MHSTCQRSSLSEMYLNTRHIRRCDEQYSSSISPSQKRKTTVSCVCSVCVPLICRVICSVQMFARGSLWRSNKICFVLTPVAVWCFVCMEAYTYELKSMKLQCISLIQLSQDRTFFFFFKKRESAFFCTDSSNSLRNVRG